MKLIFKRICAASFVFLVLTFYLYGMQLAYESKDIHPIAKALLFASTLFGGSLSWDIAKHIFGLPERRFNTFAKEIGKTVIFMFGYSALFVLAFRLLGAWAGPQTMIVGFIAILSAAACIKALQSFDSALKAAVLEEGVALTMTNRGA